MKIEIIRSIFSLAICQRFETIRNSVQKRVFARREEGVAWSLVGGNIERRNPHLRFHRSSLIHHSMGTEGGREEFYGAWRRRWRQWLIRGQWYFCSYDHLHPRGVYIHFRPRQKLGQIDASSESSKTFQTIKLLSRKNVARFAPFALIAIVSRARHFRKLSCRCSRKKWLEKGKMKGKNKRDNFNWVSFRRNYLFEGNWNSILINLKIVDI